MQVMKQPRIFKSSLTMFIFKYYLNPIVSSLCLFGYWSMFWNIDGVTPVFQIYFLSLLWFFVAWCFAVVQLFYGGIKYRKTRKSEYLNHVYSFLIVCIIYLVLFIMFKTGYYLTA